MECYATHLLFGGPLSRGLLEELGALADEAGAELWVENRGWLDPTNTDEIVEALAAGVSEPLELSRADRPWGRFERIEQLLTDRGVPWYLWRHGDRECDAAGLGWQPGWPVPREYRVLGGENGAEVVTVDEIRSRFEALPDPAPPYAADTLIRGLLRDYSRPEIPPPVLKTA